MNKKMQARKTLTSSQSSDLSTDISVAKAKILLHTNVALSLWVDIWSSSGSNYFGPHTSKASLANAPILIIHKNGARTLRDLGTLSDFILETNEQTKDNSRLSIPCHSFINQV